MKQWVIERKFGETERNGWVKFVSTPRPGVALLPATAMVLCFSEETW
jgi:hypothetical protein